MASKQSKNPADKPAKKKIAVKKKAAKKIAATKTTEPIKATKKKAAAKKAAPKKRKKRKSKTTEHYVDGKEFYAQLKEYYITGDLKDYLAIAIQKIATGLSFAPNFINYSYKDEMVGDAVLKMFLAIRNKKFNCETHDNPFSYFTTIAFHAFINRIKKEKKHRDTITRYQETVYSDMIQENTAGVPIYTDPSNVVDDE